MFVFLISSNRNFPFPLLVTACHMGFISLCLGLMFRFTNWCEKPSVPTRLYYFFVVPYSILVALVSRMLCG